MNLMYALLFYFFSLILTVPFRNFLPFSSARFASIFLTTLLAFLLAHFLNFRIAFAISITAIFAFFAIYTLKSKSKPEFKIEKAELIFASVFFYFIFLRFLNPSIFDAEKFMDMAFMNSILKSPTLPPNDPFFANEKLDCYYYFGHVLGAAIILISLSPPEVGYNIVLSAIAAYSALLVYGIFEKDRKIALFAVFFVLFAGNAYSFIDFIRRPLEIDFLYYWNSTRVVSGTINEFPYFSFIHADLHAHVFAIPVKIFLISLLLRKSYPLLTPALFAIFATNSWDYPVMLALAIFFSFLQKDKKILFSSIISIPVVFAYYLFMNLPKTELVFQAGKSDPLQFLGYSATLLILAYAVCEKRFAIYSIPFAIPTFFLSPILPILIPLAVSSALEARKNLAAILILLSTFCFAIPDFIAIDSRVNTVFKFYLTAWLLMSIGNLMKFKAENARFLRYLVLVLFVIGIVYPIVATPLRYHTAELTLDGMSFTKLYGEYEAIQWLKEREGVIIEEGCTHGSLCGYQYGGRVAVFSGNPAVIAWTGHEYQWRRNYTLIAERAMDVRDFYSSMDCNKMVAIVKKYNVSYVFLGYEERRIFSINDAIFENCFEKVFERGNVKIFLVKN